MYPRMKSGTVGFLLLLLLAGAGIVRVVTAPPGVEVEREEGRGVSASAAGEGEPAARPAAARVPAWLEKFLLPGERAEASDAPFPHWEIFDRAGKPAGIALESTAVAPRAGAASSYSRKPVNVGCVVSAAGTVRGCVLLASGDDGDFVKKVLRAGFMGRFAGRRLKEVAEVDAVSGATCTSASIVEGVRAAVAAAVDLLAERAEDGRAPHAAEKIPPLRPEPVSPPKVSLVREKIRGITSAEAARRNLSMKEALFYRKLAGKRVRCLLCPFSCLLKPGERGQCRVRVNLGGTLYTLVYGRVLAYHVDPIEKKPLYHFLPASRAYSVATAGCNLRCIFCQNYLLSQAYPEGYTYARPSAEVLAMESPVVLSPEDTVREAMRKGCRSIAFTYSEPSVFYEYMLDTARLARKNGIRTVWVTAGYLNKEPLERLCRWLDAANVDLKGFTEEYYRKYCNARLDVVLDTLRLLRRKGVWVEITNLIVPGGNDDPAQIRRMCKWIGKNLGTEVPLHFSRFFPRYKMADSSPTPLRTLETAARIAREEGLKYVYLGNVRSTAGEDTFCPRCGKKIIDRWGYYIKEVRIENGRCAYCGYPIQGVWK